jgi:hypothetical protein
MMRAGLLGTLVLGLMPTAIGCLDRPVAPASPRTSNTLTDKVRVSSVDKIDLLFLIDNSASMADKQSVLSAAVPDLVDRLINPVCVTTDAAGKTTQLPKDQQPADTNSDCPPGSAREFSPIVDIHIGVVTSSLGGHGADICQDVPQGAPAQTPTNNFTRNDQAHLITRGPKVAGSIQFPKVPTYQDAGFFAWDPTQKKQDPPGEADPVALKKNFGEVIVGTDQIGCGYEASLEGWYRFLVEPNPPAQIVASPTVGGEVTVSGTDTVLLQQRTDFLRPDSLVAVVLLSDENDCSVIDGKIPAQVCDDPELDENGIAVGCKGELSGWPKGYVEGNFTDVTEIADGRFTGNPFPSNYLVAQQRNPVGSTTAFHLKSGTSACATDPSSPECKNCYTGSGPGCTDLPADKDAAPIRCWNQKQRFGWDALYPLQRYIDGLKSTKIYDRNGYLVTNPLFDDLPFNAGKRPEGTPLKRAKFDARDPKLIFFAPIVGVPWQDIARNPDNLAEGYLPSVASADEAAAAAKEMRPSQIDWDLILGDPFYRESDESKNKGRLPTDPLMIETNQQRPMGTHPITKEPVGQGAPWNKINGHEWLAGNDDLQYACIFPLPKVKDCAADATSCDCSEGATQMQNNPLCETPVPMDPGKKGDGKSTTTQYRAKGYPGTRFLQVAKEVRESGIVASICASNLDDPNAADYGYRPAVATIIDRLKTQLTGRCLPRQLAPNPDGSTPCLIIDARFPKEAGVVNDPNAVKECKLCKDSSNSRSQVPADVLASLGTDVKDKYDCLCQVNQLTNSAAAQDLNECRTVKQLTSLSSGHGGWCYVDPGAVDPAAKNYSELYDQAAAIVEKCPANEQRTIRFVNADTQNTTLFITCLGAASGTTVDKPATSSGAAGAAGSGGLAAAPAAGAPTGSLAAVSRCRKGVSLLAGGTPFLFSPAGSWAPSRPSSSSRTSPTSCSASRTPWSSRASWSSAPPRAATGWCWRGKRTPTPCCST